MYIHFTNNKLFKNFLHKIIIKLEGSPPLPPFYYSKNSLISYIQVFLLKSLKHQYFDFDKWKNVSDNHMIPGLFKQYIQTLPLPLVNNNIFNLLRKTSFNFININESKKLLFR
jgi:hypothetical protein